MRIVLRTAAAAALCLFAGASVASADGWGDNTAYRNYSWSGSSRDVRSSEGSSERAAPRQRSARVVEADDEDRPQRRSRSARTERASSGVARGSVASSDSGSGGTTGMASFYWQPQRVASGGWFNPNAMTAAHKTLPFGTRVRVTHVGNGRSAVVTINDRGPYIGGRIIDLSKAAASAINMTGQGVAMIRMTVLGR